MKYLVKETARNLRKNQTETEAVLWEALRNRKLLGLKFLRQHPIVFQWDGIKRFLIADFYCREAGMIVELDGAIHDKRKDHDDARDYTLKGLGFDVLRFRNEKIKSDLKGVLRELRRRLSL